jgi:hypothetical protein
MKRVTVSALILASAAQLLMAQEQPPEDVFNHSSRDLVFRVPPELNSNSSRKIAGHRS